MPKMNAPLILTFGYGNRTNYDDLRLAFNKYDVSFLIDVRKKPRGWSAIWNASKLSDFCESVGVSYLSKTALGNDSGTHNWTPPDLQAAKIELDNVSELSTHHNILLLCAEKKWQRCHRVEVSEHIKNKTGNEVLHLD